MNLELLHTIAITKIPKVGAVTAKNLISYCGSAEKVFKASKQQLLKVPRIGEKIATDILKKDVLNEAEKELKYIEKHKINALTFTNNNYPVRLKQYNDCPIILYYKGTSDLNHNRIVGIVGTRKPSVYGKSKCEEIVAGLKDYNVLVISGLAYGIDITAHKKCLEEKIETVGVMGHGMGRIYPPRHRATAVLMTKCGGLLTEYTSAVGPDRMHFPMRNRIIAGMCDALLVVETARKGGSMITAEIGNNYNKDVFAVPGRPKDENSKGCNFLIKAHKAALVETAADIAYNMSWEVGTTSGKKKNIQKQLFVDLSFEEKIIIELIKKTDEVSIDRLTYESDMNSSEIASLLLGLEFKGLIKTLPGKRYILT